MHELTIMFSPLGNNHQIPGLNLLLLPRNDSLTLPRSKDQMLINMVYLLPDLSADWDGHNHKLGAFTGEEDVSEF